MYVEITLINGPTIKYDYAHAALPLDTGFLLVVTEKKLPSGHVEIITDNFNLGGIDHYQVVTLKEENGEQQEFGFE